MMWQRGTARWFFQQWFFLSHSIWHYLCDAEQPQPWEFLGFLSQQLHVHPLDGTVQPSTIMLLRHFCRVRSPNLGGSALLFAHLITSCQKQSCRVNISAVGFAISPSFTKILAKRQSAKFSLQIHEALNEVLQIPSSEYWPDTQMCLETGWPPRTLLHVPHYGPSTFSWGPGAGQLSFGGTKVTPSYLKLEKHTWSVWIQSLFTFPHEMKR